MQQNQEDREKQAAQDLRATQQMQKQVLEEREEINRKALALQHAKLEDERARYEKVISL